MDIDVFGLGYVGSVLTACLASKNNKINAIEVDQQKINLIREGKSPIDESNLDELLHKNLNNIVINENYSPYQKLSKIGFICVGTPYIDGKGLDFQYIYRVIDAICIQFKREFNEIKIPSDPYVVIIRSTTDINFFYDLKNYINLNYGLTSKEITLALFPEFLREGSAISDFFDKDSISVFSAEENIPYVNDLLSGIFYWNKPAFIDIGACSQIKLISNSWHALKVAFTNETSQILNALGVNSHKIFEEFCKDTKLNISSAYMKPGFAYGGSCLTKDLAGLIQLAKKNNINTYLLNGVQNSNFAFIKRVADEIKKYNSKFVFILGLTFKTGTDDLRESPFLTLTNMIKSNFKNLSIVDDLLYGKLETKSLSRGNQLLLGDLNMKLSKSSKLQFEHINGFEDSLFVLCHSIYFEKINTLNFVGENNVLINLTSKEVNHSSIKVKRFI